MATKNPSEVRILVVDDDPDFREIMVFTYRKMGYQVLEAPNGRDAFRMIQEMMMEAEVGKTYPNAKVKSITSFGAFVEFLPGKEGLVHISELENRRVEKVEDVVALGDQIPVKCIGIDGQGKVRLSRKATLAGN